MKPHLIVRLGLVCLLTILAVSAAAADQSTAGPDQIGSKATASWTETTEKAATTPEQKKILASGKVATDSPVSVLRHERVPPMPP